MKLGVISDIHGNLAALAAVLQALDAEAVDTVVNLGDSLSGPLQPFETAQLLLEPKQMVLVGEVLLVHGTPATDCECLLETVDPGTPNGMRAADESEVRARLGKSSSGKKHPAVILCGHSHVPRTLDLGTSIVVNPGSVGLQAYAESLPHPHVAELGSPHARFAVVERANEGWDVRLESVEYDWESQARVAQERGWPVWAHALRTGLVPIDRRRFAASVPA